MASWAIGGGISAVGFYIAGHLPAINIVDDESSSDSLLFTRASGWANLWFFLAKVFILLMTYGEITALLQ